MNNLPATTGQGRPDPYAEVYQLLERQKPQIAKALPIAMKADHLARVAMTCLRRDRKFERCDPLEIVGCVMEAAQLGLEIGGVLGQCYLVPYEDKKKRRWVCQLRVGYKGMLALARRSGKVKRFAAHVVCANDDFDYQLGSEAYLFHRPKDADRGKPVKYYAEIQTTDGGYDFEVMTVADVEAHRNNYVHHASPAWDNSFDQMALKTLILRLAKRCPVSTEIQRAASLDEYAEVGVDQELRLETIEGTVESATTLPMGRQSRRTPIQAAQAAEPEPEASPPAAESPREDWESGGEGSGPDEQDSGLGWEAAVRGYEGRIAAADSVAQLHGIRLELDGRKDWLGEDKYKELLALGKQRYQEIKETTAGHEGV